MGMFGWRGIKCIFWAGITGITLLPIPVQAQSADSGAARAAAADAVSVPANRPLESGVFAKVNGKTVTMAEFHAALGTHLRKKFYHGQIPDDQLVKAREDVAEQIVSRLLFLDEADRRGTEADMKSIEARIAAYEQRNAANPAWQKDRENLLAAARKQLVDDGKISQLETAVRAGVPAPLADEVRTFYAANPALFTEPERVRLHTILLEVAPSSTSAVWEAAMAEAKSIVRRVNEGANFAEIAKTVSADSSAEKGGDMGYLHAGVVNAEVQEKIATFKLGEVGEPIRMLQGVAIFRVDERQPARLMDFDRVQVRATELAWKARRDRTWQELAAQLRKQAQVVVMEGRMAAVPAPVK